MKLPKRSRSGAAGFTLVEIMLVVAIIAVLAGLAIYNLGDVFKDAQIAAAKADMRTYKTALISYRVNAGSYPSTADGLKALTVKPPNGRKAMEEYKLDPWKNDYAYFYPGQKNKDGYDIFSKGEDKIAGTEDDVWP